MCTCITIDSSVANSALPLSPLELIVSVSAGNLHNPKHFKYTDFKKVFLLKSFPRSCQYCAISLHVITEIQQGFTGVSANLVFSRTV